MLRESRGTISLSRQKEWPVVSDSSRRATRSVGLGGFAVLFVAALLVAPSVADAQTKSRASRRAQATDNPELLPIARPRTRIPPPVAAEETVEAAPEVAAETETTGKKRRRRGRRRTPSDLAPQNQAAQELDGLDEGDEDGIEEYVEAEQPASLAAPSQAVVESAPEPEVVEAPPAPRLDVQIDAIQVLLAKRRLDEAAEAIQGVEDVLAAKAAGGELDVAAAGRLIAIRVELAQALLREGRRVDAFNALDAAFAEAAGFPELSAHREPVLAARLEFIQGFVEEKLFDDAFRELAAAAPVEMLDSEKLMVRAAELAVATEIGEIALKLARSGAHPKALTSLGEMGAEAPEREEVQEVFAQARLQILQNLQESVRVALAKKQFKPAGNQIDAVAALKDLQPPAAQILAQLRLDLANAQIEAGQLSAALNLLLVVERADELEEGINKVSESRLAVAKAHIEAGRALQALPVLDLVEGGEKTPDEIKDEAALLRVSALAKHAERQPDDGLRRLEQVADREASDQVADAIAMARVAVAQNLAARNRQPVALAALNRAAELERNSEDAAHAIAAARLDVARSYAKARRFPQALDVLDAAEKADNPVEVAEQIVLDRLEYLLTQPRPDQKKADALVVAMLRKNPDGEIFERAIEQVKAIVDDVRNERVLVVLDEPGALRPDRPVRLRARVLDPKTEVASLHLRYRSQGTQSWDSEEMRKTTGDWTGFIRRPDALAPAGKSDDYQVEFVIEAQSETGRKVDSYGSREEPALLDISTARWQEAESARREAAPVLSELPEVVLEPAPQLEPGKPWYTRWYTIAGASAVVVGTAAVVTAVILSKPPELPEHDARIVLP